MLLFSADDLLCIKSPFKSDETLRVSRLLLQNMKQDRSFEPILLQSFQVPLPPRAGLTAGPLPGGRRPPALPESALSAGVPGFAQRCSSGPPPPRRLADAQMDGQD